MSTSDFFAEFQEQAKLLLENKGIRDIIFSNGSYQIEVFDLQEKTSFWPMIQLDESSQIRDAFCTCQSSEKNNSCVHLAAAYLAIFRKTNYPLSVRYVHSFWYQICFILCRRIGIEPARLKKENERVYSFYTKTHKLLFSIQLYNQQVHEKFIEILFTPLSDKEGSSLKYSLLSEEEVKLWKKKEASPELNFELSFWSDLAKWWLFLQEENIDYNIEFTKKGESLPKGATITFPHFFQCFVYIAEKNWKYLIPSISTIHSSLEVEESQIEKIEKITYIKEEKKLHVESAKVEEKIEQKQGYRVGGWIYVENKGFYKSTKDPLAQKKWIEKEEISFYLSEYVDTISSHLVGYTIQPVPSVPNYKIFFDREYNLHVQLYLFTAEECELNEVEFFCPWYFLPSKGFYLIDNPLLPTRHEVICKEDVSDFVHRHRLWLNGFSGFHTHYGLLPTKLNYRVTKEQNIEFFLKVEFNIGKKVFIDFKDWTYVQGQGFYIKKQSASHGPLRSGLIVLKKEIKNFIEANLEELEQIKDFFSLVSPIEEMQLDIYPKQERIVIEPHIRVKEGYNVKDILFFGKYTYVEGEGFSSIASKAQIPARYQKKSYLEQEKIGYFIQYELDRLHKYIGKIDPKICPPKNLCLILKKLQKKIVRGKTSWYADLSYRSEKGEVSVYALYKNLHKDNRAYSFTRAGLIHLKESRFQWLLHLSSSKIHPEKKYVRLTTLELLRLCLLENLEPPRGYSEDKKQTKACFEELISFSTDKLLCLDYLVSNLWPYQEIGVKWLWFLYSHQLSGLLCDDMGLGKTHQSMALLAAVLSEDTEQKYKYLVICPTSVIYHWEELCKKFLPKMRVLVYYGVERNLANFTQNYDLLLTSYGVMRQSKEDLTKLRFEVAIYDELQIAKNPFSQTHKALKNLKTNVRIGLSGTPIENSVKDLKALFDIILPTYFPSEADFREQFYNPIEKYQDPEKRKELAKMIRPFVMRRKKKDVLLDLPEKMEEIAYCELSSEQKELYANFAKQQSPKLINELRNSNGSISYMHIFALLTKLKQICNHPCMVHKDASNYNKYTSGKWELFTELLQEAQDSKQKVVVFSQYIEMIEIIEHYLLDQKITYAVIKGSTRNRYQNIQKFQKDPDCQVFVASLLAAGVGIDLTAGSVVIHYDRWWNPAKENQATDRVHRIGQNRGVQVFKLVTKNTIEEHIHQIIEKKHGLMEEVLGEDESEEIKSFSKEDLLSILEKISHSLE